MTVVEEGRSGQKCGGLVRVLSPEERALVERIERDTFFKCATEPDVTASLLLRAQVYERLGLFDDARSAYHASLQLHHPNDEGLRAALAEMERRRGAP